MATKHRWIATTAKLAGRYDDCFFTSQGTGWAINGAGEVYRTDDGAKTWQPQELHHGQGRAPYLRCMGMLNSTTGWIGCTTNGQQLFSTEDGGWNWRPVSGLPNRYNSQMDADAPRAVCGLHVLDEHHIFASGTNNPENPARFLWSTDGGCTWRSRDMEDVATALIDIYFQTPDIGWVVGGRGTRPNSKRSDVLPVVLKTENRGKDWVNKVGPEVNPPLGEWGWKIQFVDEQFIVVACENFKSGAILISEDGGESWRRQEIRDAGNKMINGNLEGIGFLNRHTGWVGGWGDVSTSSGRTSGTQDGGATWEDLTASWPPPLVDESCLNDVDRGQYINRFRFVNGFGYASGNTVYKYTDEDVEDFNTGSHAAEPLIASDRTLTYEHRAGIPIRVKPGTKSFRVEIYDRFAGKIKTLTDENDPSSGDHVLEWDLTDDNGRPVEAHQFLVRAIADGKSDSRLIARRDTETLKQRLRFQPHMLRMLGEA